MSKSQLIFTLHFSLKTYPIKSYKPCTMICTEVVKCWTFSHRMLLRNLEKLWILHTNPFIKLESIATLCNCIQKDTILFSTMLQDFSFCVPQRNKNAYDFGTTWEHIFSELFLKSLTEKHFSGRLHGILKWIRHLWRLSKMREIQGQILQLSSFISSSPSQKALWMTLPIMF